MMFALNFVAVRYGLKSFVFNFFDPYKKPNGRNICRDFAANNDFPYGKFPAGKIGGGAGGKNQFGKHRLPNFAAV